MQIDNLTIAWLLQDLKPILENSFINKIQELEKNYLKIKLHSNGKSLDLIISPEALYLTQFKLSAIQKPKGFAGFLKKHLSNKKIIKAWQKDLDRVIILEFEKYFLILEFFAEGNIILCNKQWEILQPFHRQEWKDRILKKGEIYKFPQNLMPEKIKKLEERLTVEKKPENLMEKIDEALSKKLLENTEEEKKETNAEKKKAKLLYSIKEQEKAKEKFLKEIQENQKKAELLYANSQEVQELLNVIKKGKEKGIMESEIEKKLLEAKSKGNKIASLIKEIKLKEKKLILDLH